MTAPFLHDACHAEGTPWGFWFHWFCVHILGLCLKATFGYPCAKSRYLFSVPVCTLYSHECLVYISSYPGKRGRHVGTFHLRRAYLQNSTNLYAWIFVTLFGVIIRVCYLSSDSRTVRPAVLVTGRSWFVYFSNMGLFPPLCLCLCLAARQQSNTCLRWWLIEKWPPSNSPTKVFLHLCARFSFSLQDFAPSICLLCSMTILSDLQYVHDTTNLCNRP